MKWANFRETGRIRPRLPRHKIRPDLVLPGQHCYRVMTSADSISQGGQVYFLDKLP